MAQGKKKVKASSSSTRSALPIPAPAGGQQMAASKQGRRRRGKGSASAAPVAVSVNQVIRAPQFRAGSGGTIRVTHREFIGDVNGSNTFATTSFSLNPALPETFPWLANVAQNYESYLFRALSFDYSPTASTSQSGGVIMAVDFDAVDGQPQDKRSAMSNQGASRSAVWQSNVLSCANANLQKFGIQRYTRRGNLASNLDIKTYDVGRLHVCVSDTNTTATIGEIYVSYTVDLFTPQSPDWGVDAPRESEVIGTQPANPARPFYQPTFWAGLSPVATVWDDTALNFTKLGTYLIEHRLSSATGLSSTDLTPNLTNVRGSNAKKVAVGLSNSAGTSGVSSWQINVASLPATVAVDFVGKSTAIGALQTLISPLVY